MTTQTLQTPGNSDQLIVVGVGASAGGLEAIHGFIGKLPERNQMAFVFVQHLDPNHDSLMQELLARRTTCPVTTAYDGCPVQAGQIYLIAPGEILTIQDNIFRTEKFAEPRGVRRPIDNFLSSLAINSGLNAVGIILSGTGSDGSRGVADIKNAGGLVLVQSPEEAKYDGMPRSAILTGACDLILSVTEMAMALEDVFDRVNNLTSQDLSQDEVIQRVMRHLRGKVGHDFSEYKPGTLLRRIAVRMSVCGLDRPEDYLRFLIDDPFEAEHLLDSILINVTGFFRDPDVFKTLKDMIIPDLVTQAGPDGTIRVWIAGCATGEEAYTYGIVFSEVMERLNIWPQIAIFATDIDEIALRKARNGSYSDEITDSLAPDLLAKYFHAGASGYRVRDRLRGMIRFSNQSLIKDPPFSQIDLLSCRNVLIYFEKSLQESVAKAFHYSLRESGILVAGASETIPTSTDLFSEIYRSQRIYRRTPGPAARLELRASDRIFDKSRQEQQTQPGHREPQPGTEEIMAQFAPPYMVLTARCDLVFASAKATAFLRISAGRPQLSILKLIRPELEPGLRRLLRLGQDVDAPQSISIEETLDDTAQNLVITCQKTLDDKILLVFHDRGKEKSHTQVASPTVDADSEHYLRELEHELDAARERLISISEELETSNEELKSSNEEMMSMNEELQSANEELTTTNDELNAKISEIRDAHADMTNFIASTNVSTVFLDEELQLRRFTPEARKQFRFVSADIGRPLDDIGSDLDVQGILSDCREVLRTQTMAEKSYESRDGLSYRARIVPFKSEKSTQGGVVISLFDVTELRKLAQEAEAQRKLSDQRLSEIEDLYDYSPQAMGMLSTDLTYLRANRRLANIAGFSVEELIGKSLGSLSPELRAVIDPIAQEVIEKKVRVERKKLRGKPVGDSSHERIWETDWYPVFHDGVISGVGLNVRDITEEERLQFELRRIMQELQHRVKNMLANVLALVSRASRDATVDRDVFNALGKRIQALAQTHKLLTQSNWASANLLKVLTPELTAVYGEDRVSLKGPEIIVNARAALSLGMAIHELATNAAKYGAFANPQGKVRLSWLRQDDGETDEYIFTWSESGGQLPSEGRTDGFGTQLIKSTITGSLNGKVQISWEPDGLQCVMCIPVGALIEIPNESIFNSLDI